MSQERVVTDWTEVPGHALPERLGDDASRWAEAFCQHARKLGQEIDDGWMIGWFANAIEASWDARCRRTMLRARCNRCRWLFDVIALPAPVDRACEAMQSTCCPMCGNREGNTLGEPRELTAFEAAHYAGLTSKNQEKS